MSTLVQCYFRAVLKEGQPIIAAITLELAGKGLSQAAILRLFTVADVSGGGGEIARGELISTFLLVQLFQNEIIRALCGLKYRLAAAGVLSVRLNTPLVARNDIRARLHSPAWAANVSE